MARDPLAALAKLRGLEVLEARVATALRGAALEAAEADAAAAEARLKAEDPLAAPLTYGSYLEHGLAARHQARALVAWHVQALESERQRLALARSAERLVELLCERRAEAARRLAARREQARLDEAAARHGN